MEILGLIIIVLIWVFKAAAANEDKKVNDRETGSVSASPDVHMDSCEDRLESLKVLYDAGILDREEYAQRVARVKKAHAQSRG